MPPLTPQDPLHEENDNFSLEQRHPPAQPLPRGRPNSCITFFRFMIWISPGPASLMLIGVVYQFHRLSFIPGVFLAAVVTLLIGACDAFLAPGVPKENGTPLIQPALEHSCKFTMLQILIAPVTAIVLGFGYCAVAYLTYA